MKKKKKKEYDPTKMAAGIRRQLEIEEHGKQLTMRGGSIFKSKKGYKRTKKVEVPEDETAE